MSPRDARGSSPLTRGKHRPGAACGPNGRLIPAHAGKTLHPVDLVLLHRAHPRSRGENPRLYGLGAMNEGSSPLTRGKPPVQERAGDAGGLIPAHAGKTDTGVMPSRAWPTHPRSRGENPGYTPGRDIYHGSSPLTRGKRLADLRDGLNLRLIPAHAGKTSASSRATRFRPAHPRSRGENGGFS